MSAKYSTANGGDRRREEGGGGVVVQGDEVSRHAKRSWTMLSRTKDEGGMTMNDTRMDRGNEGVEFK